MKPFRILATVILFVAALLLGGCATTDQKQPTAQEQPQRQSQAQAQKDEQWADLRIVATNNFYGGGAATQPAKVAVGDEDNATDTVTEATPGESAGAGPIAITNSPISVTITVTTHGQSSKEGSATTGQTGGSQASNTKADATTTNDVKPSTTLTAPAP